MTRLNYAYDLRIFFDFLSKEIPLFLGKKTKEFQLSDIDRLNTRDIENFLNYLSYYTQTDHDEIFKNSERGKARKLSSVRAFFKYYFKKGKISKNIASNVDTPKLHEKEIIRLEGDEISKLLNMVSKGSFGSKQQDAFKKKTELRDYAMLALFLGTGIRISECVGLNKKDVDLTVNAINVTRKGGAKSVLYFSDEVAGAIKEYLNWLDEQ